MKKVVAAIALSVSMAQMLMTSACQSPSPAADDKPTYRIGYMICNSEAETLRRFRPLTAYLSKELGVNFEAVAIDTVDFLEHVDELDFTHTNSLLYINMHRFNGVEVLAAEKSGRWGSRAAGAIVALKKSGLKMLTDLKGKTMVFGPALGPLSFMTQVDLLQKAGVDPDEDLASYSIPQGSFKHEKVLYSVLFGKHDAGAVPMHDFDKMAQAGKIAPDDFQVLAVGEPIPYCNFASTQRVDDALAKRFADALVGIDTNTTAQLDGEVVKVLSRASIDGYEGVRDDAFDSVRAIAKRTNMPPYQSY